MPSSAGVVHQSAIFSQEGKVCDFWIRPMILASFFPKIAYSVEAIQDHQVQSFLAAGYF